MLVKFYKPQEVPEKERRLIDDFLNRNNRRGVAVSYEHCYYVNTSGKSFERLRYDVH